MDIKAKLINTIFVPTLTYQCQTWTLSKAQERKLTSCEMRCLRRAAGKTRRDRVRNDVIRQLVGNKPVLQFIAKQRVQWFGHLMRMPTTQPALRAYTARHSGVRARGRPRRRWIDGVAETLRAHGMTLREATHLAVERVPTATGHILPTTQGAESFTHSNRIWRQDSIATDNTCSTQYANICFFLVSLLATNNQGRCTCPPPFILWTFPTESKDPDLRKHRIKLVNRKNWTVTLICSKHFQDGKPTPRHPYPTEHLHLGYGARPPSARKPPAVRRATIITCIKSDRGPRETWQTT
ncbi:hypothetical protein Bbelb_284060 [Branchiostoma belcheri]|nr:hypothetical protein Bbelb_284060 [Branchiostoma belcheri]